MTVPRQSVHVDSPTERRNPRTTEIDRMSTLDILRTINSEDQLVPTAVAAALPHLSRAVDMATEALQSGHRVHYVGAGTSGRLATLDAAELTPTYNVPAEWFLVHHAGGPGALREAVEGAEDDECEGAAEMRRDARPGDFVLGLTASGRTPYVLGALAEANRIGAKTALVSNNPDAARAPGVDLVIAVDTGPEAISGSTRMKAGTAQKILLTTFSTAVMVKMGRTYSNLMVSMRATNAKLRGRSLRILREATGSGQQECSAALLAAHGDLKVAMVHLLSGVDVMDASRALAQSSGHVRRALGLLGAHAY
ncbi:N-acetylmuramic acid 6-phosphate etherase [Actinokineospora globicatena]|uniref:N-acetylmuramic acid 6-phosphate etherase n=1 Tax=Actinokineospora globicatena TaxID=103729 RepID=A0A9W6VCZ9_9PSEU|nr:N-acetylmuramic acid 6-phosphate etherase [Actinokineospora globicatena]MCP2300969.1 N-acetylmuramic acid 6-phosphate etherase [Actinokineospora globicatena]GLW77400.1 N-acetylmuramic acid 6-phosphate etherase [Actinokineospora globicatena]GLW84234.1 N-acetylmuramic acid 6-phosphate etherase [Actinokineospora globicatena]GLW95509.1 N-acetylmuramic acid 6-phosphate etherase [Actinokineospora globicatena]